MGHIEPSNEEIPSFALKCQSCGSFKFVLDESRIDYTKMDPAEEVFKQGANFKIDGTTEMSFTPKFVFYKCADCGWEFDVPIPNEPKQTMTITFHAKPKKKNEKEN